MEETEITVTKKKPITIVYSINILQFESECERMIDDGYRLFSMGYQPETPIKGEYWQAVFVLPYVVAK